jgi:hypothetical protein
MPLQGLWYTSAMSRRKSIPDPIFRFQIWLQVSRSPLRYKADVIALKGILDNTKTNDKLRRHRMGAGYPNLAKALNGDELDRYEINSIEFALGEANGHDHLFM